MGVWKGHALETRLNAICGGFLYNYMQIMDLWRFSCIFAEFGLTSGLRAWKSGLEWAQLLIARFGLD
jgi:hypothetical protein